MGRSAGRPYWLRVRRKSGFADHTRHALGLENDESQREKNRCVHGWVSDARAGWLVFRL